MKVRRNIAATPQRTAKDTWLRIVALISNGKSNDRDQLERAASVMEALIAEEHPKDTPIIVSGCGPRLVIYLRYDSDALELGGDVEALSWNPTDGDWSISAPTAAEDLDWMRKSLKARALRVSVRDVNDAISEDATADAAALTVNWGVLCQ